MEKSYEIYFGQMASKDYCLPTHLEPYIEKYNLYKNSNNLTNTQLNLVANGKIIFYIFFNNNFAITKNKDNLKRHNNFILGLSTLKLSTPITLQSNHNSFGCITTSFTYRGLIELLGMLPSELTNKSIDIETLFGNKGKQLIEEIVDSTTDAEKVHLLNQFFTKQIKTEMNYKQKSMNRILDLINNSNNSLSVHKLSENSYMSYRTVHRLFQDQIGLCPKDYLNIIRFNRMCNQFNRNPNKNWNDIIFDYGYYDQAHFINEFKQIMHTPPKQFVNMCKGKFYLERPVFLGNFN
jgi:AraC-like DNA-binding protein